MIPHWGHMPWTEQLRPNRKTKDSRKRRERWGGRASTWRGREQNGINWSWSGALHSEEAGFAYLCSGAEGEMCRCWQQAEYLKPPLTPLQTLSTHTLWYTMEGALSQKKKYPQTHTNTSGRMHGCAQSHKEALTLDLRSGDGKLCALLCSSAVMYSSACCSTVSSSTRLISGETIQWGRPFSAATQTQNYLYRLKCIHSIYTNVFPFFKNKSKQYKSAQMRKMRFSKYNPPHKNATDLRYGTYTTFFLYMVYFFNWHNC